MQLSVRVAAAVLLAGLSSAPTPAGADDRVGISTTWFQEARDGPKNVTIIHPQFDVGVDMGETVSVGLGYSADIVSGATPVVYSVDAVSTATTFDDARHSGSFSLGFAGKRSSLLVNTALGVERDYLSIIVGADATIQLPGKNTTLNLAYSHNFDEVCDKENADTTPYERRALSIETCAKKNGIFGDDKPVDDTGAVVDTVWRDLTVDTSQATITQNFSPTVVGQLSVFGSVLRGFQSNPYRRVRVAGYEPQENLPDVRGRLAVTGRINKYIEPANGALAVMARFYSDTWRVNSGTVEMAYNQYIGASLLFRVRSRIYQQSAAKFFKDAFAYDSGGAAGGYFTGDRELAPLRNVLVGGKISYIAADREGGEVWGLFDDITFHIKGDLLFYQELPMDGSDDEITDKQFITGAGLVDAFVLQLGLVMRW